MKIKCQYCGTMFNDTLSQCPQCGAPSEGVVRTTKSQPLTIEQLKQWYTDRGLPPYTITRFFIGKNHRGAKAFGIYQDEKSGNFIVYKNLANGERKIRYEGTDEAYAVNELYMRLKQEIIQQKKNAANSRNGGTASGKSSAKKGFPGWKAFIGDHKKPILITLAVLIIGSLFVYSAITTPSTGYYHYNGTNYYHARFDSDTDNWYYYDDDTYSWEHTYDDIPEELTDDATAKDFYYTPVWDSSTQEGDFDTPVPFEVSEYADQYSQNTSSSSNDGWSNSDDDDDYDWDSGDSWDSGGTDWDSDW